MTETRLQDIEMALAHQDQQIQDLSDMITKQWVEIDRLNRKIRRTEAKITEMELGSEEGMGSSVADMAAEDKPPHY